MKYVIKRNGNTEPFDSKKLYGSIFATCLACDCTEDSAAKIAKTVSHELSKWLDKKTEVSTNDIHTRARQILHKYSKPAGYLYAHHRIIA